MNILITLYETWINAIKQKCAFLNMYKSSYGVHNNQFSKAVMLVYETTNITISKPS